MEKMVRSQGFSSRIRADLGSPHYLPISWRCGCCSTSCTQRKTLSPASKSFPSHPELVTAPFPTLIPKTLCMGANLLSDQDVEGQKASSRVTEAHAVVFPLEQRARPSGCALSHQQTSAQPLAGGDASSLRRQNRRAAGQLPPAEG